MKLTVRLRIIITVIIVLLVWSHVIWDYFHGGIPTHYLFQDASMPGIPNWLGAILLPFFTWFLLGRIRRRVNIPNSKESLGKVGLRFLAAALVAIAISVCFTLGIEIPGYVLLSIFVLAFFFPLFNSEYVLGWVMGSAFTFGAVIPMGFGSLFALVCFVLYKIASAVRGFLKRG